MSLSAKLLALAFIIIVALAIFIIVKKGKISLKYSIIWFACLFVLALFTLFPGLLAWITKLFGIQISSNFIFAFMICTLFIICISLTVIVSGLTEKVRNLIQEVSILKMKETKKKKISPTAGEGASDLCKKNGDGHMKYLLVALYLILTVSGLILYKLGANKGFNASVSDGFFKLNLSVISIIGLLFYLVSFLIYIFILPKFDLSFIMPLTSAISYMSIFILSILILKETVTVTGIIGAVIIGVGIVIINIR